MKHRSVPGLATVLAVSLVAACANQESRPVADCSRGAAQPLVRNGDFAAVVERAISEPAGGAGPSPRILQLECGDVTGDGIEEMVLRVGQGKPSEVSPWAIFSDDGGEWRLALARDQVSATLELDDRGVVETQPVYRAGDRACCPSGTRSGVVGWDGEGFAYTPDEGTPERTIVLGPATVRELGSFRPPAGVAGAVRAFGTPAQTTSIGRSCVRAWPDLGLSITFASLGIVKPCAGAVQTISIDGLTGEQAGWQTGDGLAIGDDLETLRSEYPDLKRGAGIPAAVARPGDVYELVTADRFATRIAVVAARVDEGRVIGIDLYAGLAGE